MVHIANAIILAAPAKEFQKKKKKLIFLLFPNISQNKCNLIMKNLDIYHLNFVD